MIRNIKLLRYKRGGTRNCNRVVLARVVRNGLFLLR